MKNTIASILSFLLLVTPIVKAEDQLEGNIDHTKEYVVMQKLTLKINSDKKSLEEAEQLLKKVFARLNLVTGVTGASIAALAIPLSEIYLNDRIATTLMEKEKQTINQINNAKPSTKTIRDLINERKLKTIPKGGSSLPLITAKTLQGAKTIKIALVGVVLILTVGIIEGTALAIIDCNTAQNLHSAIVEKRKELIHQERILSLLMEDNKLENNL